MLYWISAFARVTAILAATFSGWFALLLGHGLRGVAPRLALDIRNAAFRLWSRLLLKAFRVRVEVEGEPPPAGSFLVSNHVSYLDIMVLASGYDAGFVAKADIRNWPALGTIFAAGDTLYLDRGRKRDLVRIMGQMDSTREKGLGLIVFPEGTSTRGSDILPLRPSLLQYAVDRKAPVYWATLVYLTPEGEMTPSRAVCWWGNEDLLPHVRRLLALSRVDVTLTFGAVPEQADNRKALAEGLRGAMLDSFTPMP